MSIHATLRTAARPQSGFTLVELMVTVAIAMFLLGGLVTIVQNMRGTYINQQSLVQLQDQQRFALTVLTDAIQAGGFVGDPTSQSVGTGTFGAAGAFQNGWVFAGSHTAGVADAVANDTVSVRFASDPNAYGPVLCNGQDISQQPQQVWTIQFGLDTVNNNLTCTVNGLPNPPTPIVGGVKALAVYYGVKRNTGVVDFNVDTYETWDVLQARAALGGLDWANINSVRVVITFFNPLYPQASQPQFITIERVIEVMARGGLHT